MLPGALPLPLGPAGEEGEEGEEAQGSLCLSDLQEEGGDGKGEVASLSIHNGDGEQGQEEEVVQEEAATATVPAAAATSVPATTVQGFNQFG